jgi:hypothetical protein
MKLTNGTVPISHSAVQGIYIIIHSQLHQNCRISHVQIQNFLRVMLRILGCRGKPPPAPPTAWPIWLCTCRSAVPNAKTPPFKNPGYACDTAVRTWLADLPLRAPLSLLSFFGSPAYRSSPAPAQLTKPLKRLTCSIATCQCTGLKFEQ